MTYPRCLAGEIDAALYTSLISLLAYVMAACSSFTPSSPLLVNLLEGLNKFKIKHQLQPDIIQMVSIL